LDSRGLIAPLWSALDGDPRRVDDLEVTRTDAWLGGPLAVDALAVGAVSAVLLAAAELAEARGAGRPHAQVSGEHVALSFGSERHALQDRAPLGVGFAGLSRFVRCADGGWARTHGNYPHHAQALARALGFDVSAGAEALVAAAARLEATELEERVAAEGGCAAALRTPEEWAAHPAGRAAADAPLVAFGSDATSASDRPLARLTDATRPAAGLRVLDLTRVIAGPIAGRTLAALGADVLRIDPPGLPEIPAQHLDTGPGKRAATLDLADVEAREALLAGADVVLMGYRPGALDRFGLAPEALAARHPHLVAVSLSAWGFDGPWAERRGFDSLVQVASGIASVYAREDGSPGALPVQALDHATGHLMAAAALRELAARARGEPVRPARLALARTAALLLAVPRIEPPATDATGQADPATHRVHFGDLALIAPPGSLDGAPLRWTHGPRPLGGDAHVWEETRI
jgi:crotonobetainyl-CoA:carnitine CoA-transferase CaiB-like acyl-CoA transferase